MRFLHNIVSWIYRASFLIAIPGTLWSAFEMYVRTLRGQQMLFFSIVHTSPTITILVAIGLCALAALALQSVAAFLFIKFRSQIRVSQNIVGWVAIFASGHWLLLATYEDWSALGITRIAICLLGLLVITGLFIAYIKLLEIPAIKLALVISLAGVGFLAYQYVASHYIPITFVGKNMLEEAVDPYTGNLDKWNRYTVAGGLNKASSFYGLAVSEVKPGWDGNRLTSFVISIDPSYPPGRVREAMNKACTVNDSDWKIINKDEIMGKETILARADNGSFACGMMVSPLGSSVTFDLHSGQK